MMEHDETSSSGISKFNKSTSGFSEYSTSSSFVDDNELEGVNESVTSIRGKLPNHSYFTGTRLSVLDQCKLLSVCEAHEVWKGRGKWILVKRDLKTTSSTDTLKQQFQKIMKLFKENNLRSLQASGHVEEYGVREVLCQEISDMMRDATILDAENNDEGSQEVESAVAPAKRVRDHACSTLKNKCSVDESTTPAGVIGCKRQRMQDVANKIREDDQKIELEKLKLKRDKVALEMKEETQHEIAKAQVEALKANSAAMIEMSKILAQQNRN